jgi:phosphoribosylaminoimidazolecarboxamide formyltransferase/IMP cyclohydrolase
MSYEAARETDPISAFGGIVALPGELDLSAAETMTEKGNFLEVVVCGSITAEATEAFTARSGWGQDVRILVAGDPPSGRYQQVRGLRGGALVQDGDTEDPVDWRTVTVRRPSPDEAAALKRAWVVAKHVKSNAIVVGGSGSVLGVGAGQMNRVQSVRLALEQAGDKARGGVLASDAFFPFPDSVETAAAAGIAAIVQPGGSKKDAEVTDAANRLGLAMVLTSVRHFRH